MKLYDISLPVFPGMVTWPDNPNVTLRRTLDQAKDELPRRDRAPARPHAQF